MDLLDVHFSFVCESGSLADLFCEAHGKIPIVVDYLGRMSGYQEVCASVFRNPFEVSEKDLLPIDVQRNFGLVDHDESSWRYTKDQRVE